MTPAKIPRGMPAIGAQIGRYRVQAVIGDGSMALVYRAIDNALERMVALKVLRPHAAADPDSQQRFIDEARLTAKLSSHPNIIDVYDVGHDEGFLFLAMELHPGPTLARLVELEGALPLPRVVHIVEQIAAALDFAHSQGIVHRDVKLCNVMIGPDDTTTLTDFGLAKALTQAGDRTVIGTVMGTPNYMSPEQVRGEQVGPASDQYSLGISTYHLLSGALPHDADSMAAILYRQAHVDLPVLRLNSAPSQKAPIDAVIRRATRKEPAARWPSIKAFAGALKDASRQPAHAGWRRYAFLVPLALAMLVAALALMGRDERPETPEAATPFGASLPENAGAVTSAVVVFGTASSSVPAATDTATSGADPAADIAPVEIDPTRSSARPQPPVPAVVAATDTAVGIATPRATPTSPPRFRPTRRPTQSTTPTARPDATLAVIPTEEPEEPDDPRREEPTNPPPTPPPPP